MRNRLPHPRHLIEIFVTCVALLLLPGLRLAPEVGGDLAGSLRVVEAAALVAATMLFAVRVNGRFDRWAAASLVVEGALVATVDWFTWELWAIAAAWSVLVALDFSAGGWARKHVATKSVLEGATAGFVAAELIAGGVSMRGGDTGWRELFANPFALLAIGGAAALGVGVAWARDFARVYGSGGERAWLLWMLWPSLGAIAATYLARERVPTWALLSLVAVTLATIMGHALAATQRPRADPAPDGRLGVHLDEAPSGGLLVIVGLAPLVTVLLTALVLAAAGVASLATS
ncbi:MAG: hypothetical protein JWN41_727 [Thermoleophilia bacterium]|nr:hypothetical protein [Thermoleophilia bacterium]